MRLYVCRRVCVEVKGVYTKVAEFTRQTRRASVSRVWGGGAVFYFTCKSKYIRTKGKRNSVSIDRPRVNSGQRPRTITACVLRSIFVFIFVRERPFVWVCVCVCLRARAYRYPRTLPKAKANTRPYRFDSRALMA